MVSIDERQMYNLQCLERIKEIILAHPDLRFTQILYNLGLCKDRFYEEPDETLKSLP